MDTTSLLAGQIRFKLTRIYYTQIKQKLDDLNQFQIGVLFALLTMISIQIFYSIFVMNSNLLQLLVQSLQMLVVIFCIFSFYTWLTIVYGKDWSDSSIYFFFLTCFLSELIIQLVTSRNTHVQKPNHLAYSNVINLANEIAQFVFILVVGTITNFFFTSKLTESFFFVMSICGARLLGSIYLFEMIPWSFNAYFIYFCSLSGVLFSHYVRRILNEINPNFKLFSQNQSNGKIDMTNDDSFIKCASNISNALFNGQANKAIKLKRKFNMNSIDSFKRRTSLPTIPLKSDKCNSGNNYLDEVINIIDEILICKKSISYASLFEHLESIRLLLIHAKINLKLTHNDLFKPFINTNQSSSSSNKAKTFLTLIQNEQKQNGNIVDSPKQENNSYSADEDEDKNSQLSIFYSAKNRNRRSLPARAASLAWSSTTTSASGMPIVENVSFKQRSSSLKLNGLLNQNLLIHSNTSNKDILDNASSNTIQNEEVKINSPNNSFAQATSCNTDNKTSDYDSGESPSSSDYNSDTDKLQLKELQYQYNNLSVGKILDEIKEENLAADSKLPWQVDDLKSLDLLGYMHDWNFPIFQLNDKSNGHILSKMAFKIFERVGLFKSFDIPVDSFIHFFTELERGYIDLPYHNKIHAADVLHACYYLTTQPVPGFAQINLNSKERQSLKHFSNLDKYKLNEEYYGSLGANFDPLELLALYCSAAMHDYDHPGRNNQFLVSINSPLALLYNDRSVLENHHAAASWQLFKSHSKYNFLTGLDSAEFKRFRHLVIENILATDLNKHFMIINDFKNIAKVKNSNQSSNCCITLNGIDWKNESDRLLTSKMIIKLADINSPLKEKELHLQWTERICEEFYQQGEEELARGIPISKFMDRNNPQVAKLQESFMSGLVVALSDAYSGAGILPGILIEDSNHSDDLSDSETEFLKDRCRKKIFYSELTSNFKSNYEMWCDSLKQEEQKNKQYLE